MLLSCWLRTRIRGDFRRCGAQLLPTGDVDTTVVPTLRWWIACRRRRTGRADIDVLQRVGALPELRRDAHHDVILVRVLVDRRDKALTEGVVKRRVDLRDGDAETRGRRPIDREFDFKPVRLLIGIDILELRHVLQRGGDLGNPGIQIRQRVAQERVLIWRVALPAAGAESCAP